MSARSRTKQTKSSSIFLLLGVSVILVLFDIVGVLSPLQSTSDFIFNPVKHILSDSVGGMRDLVSIASSYPQLTKDISSVRLLQKRVLELEQKTGELSQENQTLREMLEAPVPAEWKLLPASVLGVSRTMIIDKGTRDGIKKGMTVIDGQYYVGRVISVERRSSHVQLPFDADSSVFAVTSRDTRGRVFGAFGEKMELRDVLQSDPLFLEDQVITTGEDGIGRGLFMGKISSIEAKDTDPYKLAILTPLMDFHTLSTVFVVLEQ